MQKLLISLLLIFTIVFTLTLPYCLCEETIYVWANNSNSVEKTNSVTTNSTTSSDSNNDTLKLESPSAILIEQTTGQVLYEKNSHEKLRPASVTKVMSILLIMEALGKR